MSAAEQQVRSTEIFWFIAQGDTLKGPYTSEQISRGIEKKDFSHSDFCWRQGFREWRPISSVNDFDRREKVQGLPTYPSVLPPVNDNFQRELATIGQSLNSKTVQKNIRISFARSPRQAISIYEWAAAIVFAVIFAFASAYFALNEVRRHVTSHLELHELGRPQSLGLSSHALPPSVWSPLYSAPSLSDVVQMRSDRSELYKSDPIDFELPILVTGQVQHDTTNEGRSPASTNEKSNGLSVGGYAIDQTNHVSLWKAEDFDLDPVYSKALQVRGYLSGHDGNTIQIKEPGEPYLAQ